LKGYLYARLRHISEDGISPCQGPENLRTVLLLFFSIFIRVVVVVVVVAVSVVEE
jgi:hypothetical protein